MTPTEPRGEVTRVGRTAALIALAGLVAAALIITVMVQRALADDIDIVQGSIWEKWIGECQWQIEFEAENLTDETLQITDVYVVQSGHGTSGDGVNYELAPGATWQHTYVQTVAAKNDCTVALEDLRHGQMRIVYLDSDGLEKTAGIRF